MTARKCSAWFGFMIVFALGLQGCSSIPSNIAPISQGKETQIAKPKNPVKTLSPPQEQPKFVIPQPLIGTDE